jgi:hypothetical protein
MAILPTGTIIGNINSELADNNAGLISAYDIRHNLVDIVESINQIVASGNFNTGTPFTGENVRAKIINNQYGFFIAESGILFPNATSVNDGKQLEPYPGPASISHNSLKDLTVGDPHIQYINRNGTRVMQGNFGLGTNWINASGSSTIGMSDRGLQFQYVSSSGENINVGSRTKFVFKSNDTTIEDGRGVARAWINFCASGGLIQVREGYNIQQIERLYTGGQPNVGKFLITFSSGVLANNNYIALGQSNSRSDNDEGADFDVNTVGLVSRTGDDASSLRQLTFYVVNDAGEYVDAAVNDLVIFGRNKGSTSGVQPRIIQ